MRRGGRRLASVARIRRGCGRLARRRFDGWGRDWFRGRRRKFGEAGKGGWGGGRGRGRGGGRGRGRGGGRGGRAGGRRGWGPGLALAGAPPPCCRPPPC